MPGPLSGVVRLNLREEGVSNAMRYRPDIDGLRAISILAVVAYHTGVPAFPGGMAGVDIFFVISGFLITGNILTEIAEDRFSFLSFFERRVRRIFPALFVLLFAMLPVILILFGPPYREYNLDLLLAAALSVGNIYLALPRDLGPLAGYDVLAHTWSLGVEEQFYLVFPATLLTLWKFARWSAWRALLVLAIGSFLWAAYETANFTEADFFVPHLRAWELLTGSLLAFAVRSFTPSRPLAEALVAAGLMMIALTVVFLSESIVRYPGPLTAVPVTAAAAILFAGKQSCTVNRFLCWRPLVFLGLISYSLYLWHLPLMELAKLAFGRGWNLGYKLGALVSVVSIVVAWASWRWVEMPFRGSNPQMAGRQIFWFFGACMVVLLLAVGLPRETAFAEERKPAQYTTDSGSQ